MVHLVLSLAISFLPTCFIAALIFLATKVPWSVGTITGTLGIIIAVGAIWNTKSIFKKQQAENLKNRRIDKAMEIQERFKVWSEQYLDYSSVWLKMSGYMQTYDSTLESMATELHPLSNIIRHWFGPNSELLGIVRDCPLQLSMTFAKFKEVGFDIAPLPDGNEMMLAGNANKQLLYDNFKNEVAFTVKEARAQMVNAVDLLIRRELGLPEEVVY
jgi:hypothetical protein